MLNIMSFNPTKQSNPKVIPFTGVNWVQFKQSITAAFKFSAVYELVVGVRTHYSDFEPLIEEIPQSAGTGESATTVTEKQIKKNEDGTYVLKEYERGMNKHLLTGTLCKPGDLITIPRPVLKFDKEFKPTTESVKEITDWDTKNETALGIILHNVTKT